MIDYVKVQPHHLFLIQPQFRPFLHFWTLIVFLGGWVSFKILLGLTYIDNQFWFLIWQQFWFLIWQHLGPLLHFFGSFGTIFLTLWSYFWGQDHCLFWKGSPIFCFIFGQNRDHFALFGPFRGFFFEVAVRIKTYFGTYLFKHSTLVLKVQAYFLVFNLATFLHFFASYGDIFFCPSGPFLYKSSQITLFWHKW